MNPGVAVAVRGGPAPIGPLRLDDRVRGRRAAMSAVRRLTAIRRPFPPLRCLYNAVYGHRAESSPTVLGRDVGRPSCTFRQGGVEVANDHRTLLASLVAQSHKTHEEHVAALTSLARRMREPSATFSGRQFERWLAGDLARQPRPANRRVMEAYYRRTVDQLLSPPPGTVASPAPVASAFAGPTSHDLEEIAMSAAHESSEHASMSSSQVEDSSIEDLQERVFRAARRYATTAPLLMFSELMRVRNQSYRLEERTKLPRQLEELYLVAGQACGLLAGISYDLGYTDAAAEQARAAFTYGKIAGHPSLSAFAMALQSTIAFWSGEPRRGVQLARDGLDLRGSGTAAIRLHAVEARSWALQGFPDQTAHALQAAELARDDAGTDDALDSIGGEFGFSPARLAMCSAAAYIALEDGPTAASEARRALELFAEAPDHERWIGGEYGARLDLVAALVIEGNLAGAEEEMRPVLDLPPIQRTERLTQRVRALRAATTRPPHRATPAARRLGDMVEHFVSEAGPRALPSDLSLPSS